MSLRCIFFAIGIGLNTIGVAAPASSYPLDVDALHDRVKEVMALNDIPGLVVGVVTGKGLIHSAAFGVIDAKTRIPMTTNVQFQIGSVTKVITATLLADLNLSGKIGLNAPIAEWLPSDLAIQDSRIREITFADLAAHRSGLPQEPINRRNVQDSPTVMMPFSREALWAGLSETELLWNPGQEFHYSNLGGFLLGELLARADGRDLEVAVTARILTPLGMADSRVGLMDGNETASHHWPHVNPRAPTYPWTFGQVWGAGGLTSTLPDLASFLMLQFEASAAVSRVLTPRQIDAMHKPIVMASRDWSEAYGLGWKISRIDGLGIQISHDGDVDGHSAFIAALPSEGIGFIVLANLGGVADEVAEEIADIVYAALVKAKSDFSKSFGESDMKAVRRVTTDSLLNWNPNNRRARFFFGRAAIHLGDCVNGTPAMQRSAASGMYRDFALYYLAVCSADAGQVKQAEELLIRARNLGFIYPERMVDDRRMDVLKESEIYKSLVADYLHGH